MTDLTNQLRELSKIQKMGDFSISHYVAQEQKKKMAKQKIAEINEPIRVTSLTNKLAEYQKKNEIFFRRLKDIERYYYSQLQLEKIKSMRLLNEAFRKKYFFMNKLGSLEFVQLINVAGMKKLSESLANMNFNFNSDGTLTIEDEKLSSQEIQNKIDEIIEKESIDIKKNSVEKTINIFINFAVNTKEAIFKIIILGIIINFLSHNVIEPIKNKIINTINKNKRVIIKKIQNEKFANEIELQNRKFVSVGTLNVRIRNSRKSAKIGELHLGDVVYVITKKRDWSLVLYKNDDVEIKGWVFSRYLKKFKSKIIKISKKIPEDEIAYLMRSPKNAARLTEAIEEIEAGKAKERELIE